MYNIFLLLFDWSISFVHNVALSLPIPICIFSLSYLFVCVCVLFRFFFLFILWKHSERACVSLFFGSNSCTYVKIWSKGRAKKRRRCPTAMSNCIVCSLCIYMWSKRMNERISERTKRDQSHKIIYTSMCMLLLFFSLAYLLASMKYTHICASYSQCFEK